jgi:hypothetical protein
MCTSWQGPKVAPFLVLQYAMPCFLDSPQVPCIARAIVELAINARHSCRIRALDCSPKVSAVRSAALRCADAAAMRADVNEPTNPKTKAMWA